jgi:hypothetical protein
VVGEARADPWQQFEAAQLGILLRTQWRTYLEGTTGLTFLFAGRPEGEAPVPEPDGDGMHGPFDLASAKKRASEAFEALKASARAYQMLLCCTESGFLPALDRLKIRVGEAPLEALWAKLLVQCRSQAARSAMECKRFLSLSQAKMKREVCVDSLLKPHRLFLDSSHFL